MGISVSVLVFTCISLIGVSGVFLITGLTGLFSLGQASFMAVGAYTSGVLLVRFGFPFPVAATLGVAAGVLAGALVGLPTVRLRRDYIALVTFGFGEAIIAILNNLTQITGGAMGLVGIPPITTLPLAVGSAIICLFFVWNFKFSKFGRQCIAVRTDELAARSMGIHADGLKLLVFLLASGFSAYAGVLYAFYTTYVDPGLFNWTRSAEWIIMVFFGGLGSLSGAVISALLLGTLPEVLRFASEWRIALYCGIVLLIINFRPKGLLGEGELIPRLKSKISLVKKGGLP
ncbi:MAG: branched-chain amino acid ABC transporter permease [Spirochaetales bacterium]